MQSEVNRLVSQFATQQILSRGMQVGQAREVTFLFSAFDGCAEEPHYLHLSVQEGEYRLVECPFDGPKLLASGPVRYGLMSEEEINARLDHLSDLARERMSECSSDLTTVMGGAAIDFMSSDERAEWHQLQLSLPSFADLRAAAQARIKQRIALRRQQHRAAA